MLSVTPILLLVAGGISALAGCIVYHYPIVGLPFATNIWIIAAVFLTGGAIADTINRHARVVAGESEQYHRPGRKANSVVVLTAVLALVVIVFWGMLISTAMFKGKTSPDDERERTRQEQREGLTW